MNKKLFLVAIASFATAFSGLNSLLASAEGIEPRTIEPRTVEESDSEIETTSDEIEVTTNCLGDNDPENPSNCIETIDAEIEGGDPDESLVVCADEDEPGCEPKQQPDLTIIDVGPIDESAPLWPMIISLSALGLAAIVIIVLNLTGPKIK